MVTMMFFYLHALLTYICLCALGRWKLYGGQPNDASNNQKCVNINMAPGPIENAYLNDWDCNENWLFMCEVRIINTDIDL
jgi:hypothetical protein